MSSWNAEKTMQPICQQYQLRICTRGKTCPYAHPGEGASHYGADDSWKPPQQLKPEEKTICKYFVRGLCKRGDKCPFVHSSSNVVVELDGWLKFCKKFLFNMCHGNDCSLLHISREDEIEYKTTGLISGNALGQAIRKALVLDVPIDNQKPVCKEELDGNCKVMNCPFRHLTREKFSKKILNVLRTEFEIMFGPCNQSSDLSKNQDIVIQKLSATAQEVPVTLPILQEYPVFPLIVAQTPPWPPSHACAPLQCATSDADTNNIDKILMAKLKLANAQVEKENTRYAKYIDMLMQENSQMIKALDPEQNAMDLDDIRRRLLEAFEVINWKSNRQLMENTQDYQHQKSLQMAPNYPNVEFTQPIREAVSVLPKNEVYPLNNYHFNDDNYERHPMELMAPNYPKPEFTQPDREEVSVSPQNDVDSLNNDHFNEDDYDTYPMELVGPSSRSMPVEEIIEDVDLLCAKELGLLEELHEDST